jgi:hypothetical protein
MGLFRPKGEEEAGDWGIPHNEELYNLYASPNIVRVINSRRMKWVGLVARVGEMRNTYTIVVRRHEWKRPLGRQA